MSCDVVMARYPAGRGGEYPLDLPCLTHRLTAMTIVQIPVYRRWLPPLFLSLAVAACQYITPQQPVPPTELPELDHSNAQLYRIDPQRSVIQLKVYRDGMLARLGHNHVIRATMVAGNVYRREDLGSSGFEFSFPVSALVIDRAEDRQRAGADFPGEIPPAHIEGTRNNMLGAELLQGDHYPTIEIRSLDMQGRLPTPTWRVAVRVRDHISELRVPVQIVRSGNQLTVQGAVKLSQRELGLAPFCVLGGKLCVRDDIDAEFYLVAVAP